PTKLPLPRAHASMRPVSSLPSLAFALIPHTRFLSLSLSLCLCLSLSLSCSVLTLSSVRRICADALPALYRPAALGNSLLPLALPLLLLSSPSPKCQCPHVPGAEIR